MWKEGVKTGKDGEIIRKRFMVYPGKHEGSMFDHGTCACYHLNHL